MGVASAHTSRHNLQRTFSFHWQQLQINFRSTTSSSDEANKKYLCTVREAIKIFGFWVLCGSQDNIFSSRTLASCQIDQNI